jgi:hypothetical protein
MGQFWVGGRSQKPCYLGFLMGISLWIRLESFVTSAKFYFDRFPMNPRELVRDMYMLVQDNPTFANPTADHDLSVGEGGQGAYFSPSGCHVV